MNHLSTPCIKLVDILNQRIFSQIEALRSLVALVTKASTQRRVGEKDAFKILKNLVHGVLRCILLFAFLLTGTVIWGQKSIPQPTDFLVNDFANMLNRNQVVALGEKLKAYEQSTSTQIVIITEESLEGADIFDYTVRLAHDWGIGQEEKSNGILIYIAEQDRKLRIQTGYGTEGFLPDAMARRIIENIIKPAFRVGRYYEGLDEATNVIIDLGKGEYTADEWEQQTSEGGLPAILILVFIVVLIIIISSFGGGDDDGDDGGYYRGGRYDMDEWERRRRRRGGWIFLPGPWGWGGGSGGGGSSDGGFGGFGGGGFGGFGGGGFGGGGAGGEW